MTFEKTLRCLGATVLVSVGTASAAFAQGETGFLRGQGHFDLVGSYSRDSFDHFWVGNDKVSTPAVGRVTRTTYSLFGAFGLTDDIDVTGNLAYVSATANGDGGVPGGSIPSNRDPQDGTFRLKWRALTLREGSSTWSLLLAPGIKVPLDAYQDNAVTAIGDGQTDYLGRIIGHLQFDNGLYFSLETGYDKRAGLPENEIPVNFTVGYTFADRVTVSPFITRVYSEGGTNIGEGPFPGNREEFTRTGLTAYVRVTENFGITGAWRTTLSGENTGQFDGYTLGAVLKF